MSNDRAITALLSHHWIGDFEGAHTLILKEDGTGEILVRSELTIALAAHLTWKIVASGPVNDSDPPAQSLLGKLLGLEPPSTDALIATIEITFSKDTNPMSLIPASRSSEIGVIQLRPSALEPKCFRVVVRKGEFIPSFWRAISGVKSPTYGLQLCFDRSPYPPVKEWIPDSWPMVRSIEPFTCVSFVARDVKK
ncbi:hypothetical protein CC1G_11124 [Coprinopsis cinerea okayama7|uniref:Uncharacterized protein n=1 Tax=Coprinopsis cinerea (strain Okayama-7 / 130 / ATCC MYA-4618 / FGSC 9003) TaxID=240176 RepID=A8N4Q9_COPC7|nr:hypothetical protein CC1G_11124 [Coprinopsis cinerea okayama7\|eukprot:XP_001829854.1 hypothetical protein CC1G_11124 [Coprinopsis cinerea okayama7\